MSAPHVSTETAPARVDDAHRTHRLTVAIGGGLAIVGAALAAFVHPAWAALAAVGGLLLLLLPDQKR